MVFPRLLCVLVTVTAGTPAPRLDVPRGFTASVYVRGIAGARDVAVAADGTLTVQGRAPNERFEIAPPTADAPLTIMRVAAELDAGHPADGAMRAAQRQFIRMRWDAESGLLGYELPPDRGERLRVAPRTLALARSLAAQSHANVALAPDGSLFVADSRAGAVWHVKPTRL